MGRAETKGCVLESKRSTWDGLGTADVLICSLLGMARHVHVMKDHDKNSEESVVEQGSRLDYMSSEIPMGSLT